MLERTFWQKLLTARAAALMGSARDAFLDRALQHTLLAPPPVHNLLAECCEAAAESFALEGAPARDGLMIVIPIVAWSKYPIPVGAIAAKDAALLSAGLSAEVLAGGAHLALEPALVGMDQLPVDFAGVHNLAATLIKNVGSKSAKLKWPHNAPDAEYMADCRFVLAGVVVPAGEPMFRWQEGRADSTRASCLTAWLTRVQPVLTRLLPGCEYTALLPDGFFSGFRRAEDAMRPATVRASVSFLETRLPSPPQRLRAIIAAAGVEEADEFRIAFTERGQDQVLTGVVWPLSENEDGDAHPGPANDIATLLHRLNVGEVVTLEGLFLPEYCEDCGAPLFPDADGEAVHAYMPEGSDAPAVHYH